MLKTLAVLSVLWLGTQEIKLSPPQKTSKWDLPQTKKTSLKKFFKEFLRRKTRIRNKDEVIGSILTESKRYGISPLLLFTIIFNESSFKRKTQHKEVITKVNKRYRKVKALGLGGIIFEFWEKELLKYKIIKRRTDLLKTKNNIEAIAFILASFKNKGYNLNESLKRYYGSLRYKRIISKKLNFLVSWGIKKGLI